MKEMKINVNEDVCNCHPDVVPKCLNPEKCKENNYIVHVSECLNDRFYFKVLSKHAKIKR